MMVGVRWLVALAACGPVAPGGPPPPIAAWPTELALHPESFAKLTATGKDGWIAIHSHRPDEALAAGGIPAARAVADQGVFWRDASIAWGQTVDRLARELDDRGRVTPDIAALAGLSAACNGIGARAAWATRAEDPELVRLLDRDDAFAADPSVPADGRWGRLLAHHASRQALRASAGVPAWTEVVDGFERHYFDPCVASGLAAGLDWHPVRGGLEAVVFSPWLTPAEIPASPASYAELYGVAPSGVSLPDLGPGDDPEGAHQVVRALDAALDGWREQLLAQASEEGRSLLVDLDLLPRFRQEWLVGRARRMLASDQPHRAVALLELAVDPATDGGPTDSPSLWLLLADARVRTGRSREALDALEHLRPRYPELYGLIETVGDLAVLEGLDRQGDSKEH
jgi:hypothetical protein